MWFSQEAYGYAPSSCSEERIADAVVRQALHREVYLLSLLIEERDCPRAVILCEVLVRYEVHRGIDRKGGVFPRERPVDVRVVSVSSRVRPRIVITSLEAIHYRRVIAEVPCTVDIIVVRCIRRDVRITEVRTREDDFVLTREQHLLDVDDAVAEFVTHGNASRLELVEQRLVHRKLQISARLDDQSDRHACVVSGDDLVGESRQLDHVKGHVDADGLFADEIQNLRVAVFKRWVAEPLLSRRALAREENKSNNQPETDRKSESCHNGDTLRFRFRDGTERL